MQGKPIKILAVETSCDETAAAIIGEKASQASEASAASGREAVVLSSVVSSQIDLHAKTGGIVPEVASRAHVESIIPVIEEALLQANNQETRYNNQLNSNIQYQTPKKLTADSSKLKADLLGQITHLAVTAGPGLIGSLLVGFNTAKAMAYALDIPIVPINHIEGHIYSALSGENSKIQETITKQIRNPNDQNPEPRKLMKLEASQALEAGIKFPILSLTVSGGHTSLTLMRDHGVYENIGSTRDDAAGEAFDKVAQLLGLGFPGGPAISKLAEKFRNGNSKIQATRYKQNSNPKNQNEIPRPINYAHGKQARDDDPKKLKSYLPEVASHHAMQAGDLTTSNLRLPRPMIDEPNFDFSFSGLKTAVLMEVKKLTANSLQLSASQKEEIAYAFEEAAVDVLVTKTMRAAKRYKPKAVILAGGVAANKRLRAELEKRLLANSKIQETITKQYSTTNHQNGILNQVQDDNSKKLTANSYNLKAPELLIAPMELCGDNAAMIGLAAFYHIVKGDTRKWDEIEVNSNMKL
ncbi:hypothetical protein A2215_02305 [Candidatus Berkelbacteria bacterium RIFOXYA2_FULL_43_10]|uniref:tRNA N6-adenosine threonylcarbamoyltransferase n=1 Tax=Candidatus Berkelbacteria bacterium RIFOXYA2_FULL_43_10 TaxID=1797472 RepID=A0A1F5E826_9BACT|nr:MAG: hypothetical protein A2215_02305 [Candidatus Berkelbacteria bacterium RIFOXYA2_FULL_43_10]